MRASPEGKKIMRLIAEDLAARRGEDLIFVNVSFQLAPGEALVLTGRNGSGKSTLLRVVAGLLRPERGRVEAVFRDGRERRPAREVSHYLGHRNAMKQELTVSENLAFWQAYLGDFEDGRGRSIGEAADMVGRGVEMQPSTSRNIGHAAPFICPFLKPFWELASKGRKSPKAQSPKTWSSQDQRA